MKGKETIEWYTISHCLAEILATNYMIRCTKVYKKDVAAWWKLSRGQNADMANVTLERSWMNLDQK
jgi:hypothetical protein